MKTKFFTFCIALVANVGVVFASDTQVDGIWYDFDNNELTAIVTYSGSYGDSYSNEYTGVVVLPSSVSYRGKTYSVTFVGDGAFFGCSGLTSVTIPNSVTGIGAGTFSGCTALTSIEIPNSVTYIGESAFSNCTALTSIKIPNSVTYIRKSTFSNCTALTSIEIPNSVTSIGENAFYIVPNISYHGSANGSPWGARSVNGYVDGYFVYSDNSKTKLLACSTEAMGEITIPSSVTNIWGNTFLGCSSLTSIEIPNSVTSIGWSAFSGCTGLTSIEIPNSVTSIGDNAFNGVNNVVYTGDATGAPWGATSINGYVDGYFVYSDDSKTTLLGSSTAIIGDITIPNSVVSIGNNAFSGCIGLTSVIIPNSVTSIGNSAFYGCSGLKSVTIGQSVISIGNNAFYGCTGLTSVIIPNSVTSIGISAFDSCNGLKSVTIGKSVISIGAGAFCNCNSLKYVSMEPYAPPSLGKNCFYFKEYLSPGWIEAPLAISIFIPCGSLEAYNTAEDWSPYASRIKYFSYKIAITPSTYGNVTVPANICEEQYLDATPNYGYHFVQWSDGNTDNPRYIEITQDTTFKAIFAPNIYEATIVPDNNEQGSVIGGGSYEYLSPVTISATPNYGYHFVQWNGVGQQIPQNTISASQAYTVAAALGSGEKTSTTYKIVGYVTGTYASYSNSYYLSDDPNVAGTFIAFKCASSAKIGDCVLVEGYLTNYRGNTPETTSGSSLTKIDLSSSNPYSFTLTCDTTIVAEFAKNIYTLTVQSADNTMGYVSSGGELEYLTKCIMKAYPYYGYHFVQWSDGNTDNPRYVQITQDTAFEASFGKNPVINYIYDDRMGYIEGDTTFASQASGDISFRAVPYPGYQFVQWTDGNKDNPRTIFLTQDTTMEAIFAVATSGKCGKDLALTWTMDTITKALTIVGEGELTENYTYGANIRSVSIGKDVTDIGFDAFGHCYGIQQVTLNSSAVVGKGYTLTRIFGSQVEEYILGGHIERIGDYAFYGSNRLTKIVIPEGCKHIGDYAFKNCGNIITIVCPSTVEYIGRDAFSSESIMNVYNYATTPQDMSVTNAYSGYALTLLRGVLATARLYVPQQSIELYRDAYFWCYFGNILPIQTNSVDVNDISVTTTETTVTVSWPQVNGVVTYELVIKDKDGNVVCTLIFNADGQLTSIAFNAPARGDAPQQTQKAGFSFTVTGLETGTAYDLTISAKNKSGQIIDKKNISFHTNGTQGIAKSPIDSSEVAKRLHNGQILIIRGDKIYTITGQEVK